MEDKPMHLSELQSNWDSFARLDPFWAILTDPRKRGNRWNPVEFFNTGREEVGELVDQASRLGVPRRWASALDFGCGVGRLTQALADHVEQVIGLDVAPSMIELARQYNVHGVRCRYEVNARADLAQFRDGAFDIVYTGRVLQHVEPRYAESYIAEFTRVLAPGGYLSFDVPSEHGFFADDDGLQPRQSSAYRSSITVVEAPLRLSPGEQHLVLLEVRHSGNGEWRGARLNAGNHWTLGDSVIIQDDGRAPIVQPWLPGERQRVSLTITAPEKPGAYRVQFDLVEEGVVWFGDLGSPVTEIQLTVSGPREAELSEGVPEQRSVEPRMEMHAVPRARVEELLHSAGARILDVRRLYHCGPTWLAFRYDCSR